MARILDLITLALLIIVVGGIAWIGYQMHLYTAQLSQRGQNYMAKKHNISYTKDGGMKVGVREMSNEEYSSRTQNYLVRTWNESRWPDYKSRFWNKDAGKENSAPSSPRPGLTPSASSTSVRPSSSRHVSGTKS